MIIWRASFKKTLGDALTTAMHAYLYICDHTLRLPDMHHVHAMFYELNRSSGSKLFETLNQSCRYI